MGFDLRVGGQQPRSLLGEQLPQLRDRCVGVPRRVDRPQPSLRIDHVSGGDVIDQSAVALVLPQQLVLVHSIGAPNTVKLPQRPGQEVPLAGHPVQLRVVQDIVNLRRAPVRVDTERLYVVSGPSERALGVEHRRRRQRAKCLTLRVHERKDHDLPAILAETDRTARLINQPKLRCCAQRQRRARVEIRVVRQRARRARSSPEVRDRDHQHRAHDDQRAHRHRQNTPSGTVDPPHPRQPPPPAPAPQRRHPEHRRQQHDQHDHHHQPADRASRPRRPHRRLPLLVPAAESFGVPATVALER